MDAYEFSTDWSLGGPIIDREKIDTRRNRSAVPIPGHECWAEIWDTKFTECGPTPLIAAMRCYVASKLGELVDIPDQPMEHEPAVRPTKATPR